MGGRERQRETEAALTHLRGEGVSSGPPRALCPTQGCPDDSETQVSALRTAGGKGHGGDDQEVSAAWPC